MATSMATMNAQLEELVNSICSDDFKDVRQLKDTFFRRVKHHTFARTNQFEIPGKLDGLEEKFQVLSNEDLSDALHERRNELHQHQQKWIPDVLDLLLHLSDDPLHKTKLANVTEKASKVAVLEVLRWSDIEDGNPDDSDDPVWANPVYSDLSSGEDEVISSAETSPLPKNTSPGHDSTYFSASTLFESKSYALSESFLPRPFRKAQEDSGLILTETQLVREILFMLQGLPTQVFRNGKHGLMLNPDVRSNRLSSQILKASLLSTASLGDELAIIRDWLSLSQRVDYMQVVQDEMVRVLREFEAQLNHRQSTIVKPQGQVVVTLSRTLRELEIHATSVRCLAKLVRKIRRIHAPAALGILFDQVEEAQVVGEAEAFDLLRQLFVKAMRAYLRPLQVWLHHGILPEERNSFFISRNEGHSNSSALWSDWFQLHETGECGVPTFLQAFAAEMLACGKTNSFFRLLRQGERETENCSGTLFQHLERAASQSDTEFDPFTASFSAVFRAYVATTSLQSTKLLRQSLSTIGLSRTLESLSLLYFHAGLQTSVIDQKLFSRIDRCLSIWNDRFLLADLYDSASFSLKDFDTSRLTIYSTFTSSRTMHSRRRSVKILSSLAIDYNLPWAIANIILPETLTSYRRVSLLLFQIRRAKYSLERIGFFHAQNTPLGTSREQKLVQATYFALLIFVNTIYDHMMGCVISSLRSLLEQSMSAATTVDEMILAHSTFARDLETCCLVSKNLIPLHNSIIAVLDHCIQFCDTVAARPGSEKRRDSDFEVLSYKSAQSRGGRRRRGSGPSHQDEDDDEDEEEDDDGEHLEGYSSFIGPDANVVAETAKIKVQFARSVDFLTAGLRGISRTGKYGEWFKILAGRLEWQQA